MRLSKKEYQIRNHRKKTTQMILTFIPDYIIISNNDKIMHIIIMDERISIIRKSISIMNRQRKFNKF